MTCIIGYKENGVVYVGGDSVATNGWHKYSIANPKVFKRDPFIFGYTSSFRMGQLIEFNLKVPAQETEGDYKYMVTKFVPALRECFKGGGWLKKEKDVEHGGYFIVGYKNELYEVQQNFSIMQSQNSYMTAGCGEFTANGAMEILKDLDLSPEEKIRAALAAVVKHDPNVAEPFVVLSNAN